MRSLPTIEEILAELSFLEYSTQTRNLAYRIQFIEFLKRSYPDLKPYGAVKTMFFKNFHDLVVNIIEHLLFISVRQVTDSPPNELTKQQLRDRACRLRIISSGTSRSVKRIFGKRDTLHPAKQVELDTKVFTETDITECSAALQSAINDIETYFGKKGEQIETTEDDEIPF